jgi:hypothetical protein
LNLNLELIWMGNERKIKIENKKNRKTVTLGQLRAIRPIYHNTPARPKSRKTAPTPWAHRAVALGVSSRILTGGPKSSGAPASYLLSDAVTEPWAICVSVFFSTSHDRERGRFCRRRKRRGLLRRPADQLWVGSIWPGHKLEPWAPLNSFAGRRHRITSLGFRSKPKRARRWTTSMVRRCGFWASASTEPSR